MTGPAEPDRPAGIFIVFEGGEGAGKTTQIDLLACTLSAAGADIIITREPGATKLGAALRTLLLHSPPGTVPAKAEALMYAADRANHVHNVVRPALNRGAIVLCGRYEDSSIAYQGHGRDLGAGAIAWLSEWATDDLHPDLVILLDIHPLAGLARAGRRGPLDRIEQETITFHEHVRDGFLTRAARTPDRYLVLDATAPAAELAAVIAAYVTALIGSSCGMTSGGDVIAFNERSNRCKPQP